MWEENKTGKGGQGWITLGVVDPGRKFVFILREVGAAGGFRVEK